jgi:hypothetical protein
VIIDFDVNKNFFLNEATADIFSKEEESKKHCISDENYIFANEILETPKSIFYEESPFQTVRKFKTDSAELNNGFSIMKQKKKGNKSQPSFFSLLNESDQFSNEKYQLLSNEDSDQQSPDLREKVKFFRL